MEQVFLPQGFRWTAATAGIKASGRPDLAIAVCDGGANAAAMFTANQVVAAPVTVGRAHLRATGGRVRAAVVNSGNANCCTGEQGIADSRVTCATAAQVLGAKAEEIVPSSTGIIGVPLPVEKITAALPAALGQVGATEADAIAFADGILTTDTKRKVAHESFEVAGRRVSVWGCCKGAGMIGPQLVPHATMLVYIFTDIDATSRELKDLLTGTVAGTFNAISIDGDMSTNDTVLLLTSQQSGVRASGEALRAFEAALFRVCASLAYQVVDDGEGVTHVITLDVTGTRTDAEALAVAKTIATSPLCKTAWSSADPNWGRLLAAAGRAGVGFDPAKTTVTIGGLPVFTRGTRDAAYDEAATHAAMSARYYTIALSLGEGNGRCRFITCDMTHEYVSINADYST